MANFLTDIFTGAPAVEAAEKQRAFLEKTRLQGNTDIGAGLTNAAGYVKGGTAAGLGNLTAGYGASTGAINQGASGALGYLDQGQAGALGFLGQGRDDYSPLSALSNKYGGATSLALGALGVNGQAGTDAARSAFTAGPGYEFNRDQGLEAINRRRNMGGMLNSGNADRDAQVFGSGLASQEYDKWMNNLTGFTNPELSATSGAATGQGQFDLAGAGLLDAGGRARAGVASGQGSSLSDLARAYYGGQAGLNVGEGNTLAGQETGAANSKVGLAANLAPGYAKTYKDAADAELAGSGNVWKAIGGAASLAAGGLGGFGALGSLGSLGSLSAAAGGPVIGGITGAGVPSGGFGSWY